MPGGRGQQLFDDAKRLFLAGEIDKGHAVLAQAMAIDPNSEANFSIAGSFLISVGQTDAAIKMLEEGRRRHPRFVPTVANLAVAYSAARRVEDANQAFDRALMLKPGHPALQTAYAKHLAKARLIDRAVDLLRIILASDPNNVEAWMTLADISFDLGNLADALEQSDRAIALAPQDDVVCRAPLFMVLFSDALDWKAIVARQVEWGRAFAQRFPTRASHRNERSPERLLRVGYVAPFSRQHANTVLIIPILRAHDPNRFETFIYAVAPPENADREHIEPLVTRWIDASTLSESALADAIEADGIDVLVDLTLQMFNGRPETFARKPAPVQINYLAYPATSGLAAMDYRVTCPQLDAPGTSAENGNEPERLIYLPDTFWCYPADTEALPIEPPPSIHAGHITFGSLNSFYKVRDSNLVAWSKILERVPASRLSLLVRGGANSRSAEARLARFGIPAGRVNLLDHVTPGEHLARFNAIDVFLDTFPYGGHTTLHDAIWMGVSSVAMAGDTPVSRAGACILHHVGLDNSVAQNTDQYVDQAVALAQDVELRAELRRTLRSRMLASPLTDARRFTRHLEAGYREAWRRWCAGLAPDHIEVAAIASTTTADGPA